jgi:hypothetical protein
VSGPVHAEVKLILAFGEEVDQQGHHTLDDFVPQDPAHFGLSVQVFIGDTVSDEFDSFDLWVCSPSWLAARAKERWPPLEQGLRAIPDAVMVGTGTWLMQRWDRAVFEHALDVVCESFSGGPDWGSVAARIGRLIPWEYDYRYDAHVDERYGEPFPPLQDS